MPEQFGLAAFSPREIAERVESVGVSKARMATHQVVMLGLLAGGFISLGSIFFATVLSDATLGWGWSRVLGGLVFYLGLSLVILAGAELFTGNNLIVMAWAARKIGVRDVMRNWTIVFITNFIGALVMVALIYFANLGALNGGKVAEQYVKIAAAKAALPWIEAFFRGVLCNVLVCLAVWASMGGRTVTDKFIASVLPITAFVACGFEHCVANMFFLPMGWLLRDRAPAGLDLSALDAAGIASNLTAVTLGNLIGGTLFVGMVYWVIYQYRQPKA
jgi:formate/nitrite transporter